LTYFYPRHIRKEDRSFFRPVMAYLNREEQDGMLSEFTAFDASLIHEKYRSIAEALEAEVADS
jgi:hemerythrin-like domain-containing protein